MSAEVKGKCPACGWSSLFLGSGGYVTCSQFDCPDPTAVTDILDGNRIHHIVKLDADTFTVTHPLMERLGNRLHECELHEWIASLPGPPRQHGVYEVLAAGGDWSRAAWRLVQP